MLPGRSALLLRTQPGLTFHRGRRSGGDAIAGAGGLGELRLGRGVCVRWAVAREPQPAPRRARGDATHVFAVRAEFRAARRRAQSRGAPFRGTATVGPHPSMPGLTFTGGRRDGDEVDPSPWEPRTQQRDAPAERAPSPCRPDPPCRFLTQPQLTFAGADYGSRRARGAPPGNMTRLTAGPGRVTFHLHVTGKVTRPPSRTAGVMLPGRSALPLSYPAAVDVLAAWPTGRAGASSPSGLRRAGSALVDRHVPDAVVTTEGDGEVLGVEHEEAALGADVVIQRATAGWAGRLGRRAE
jgi:hypothetical protein